MAYFLVLIYYWNFLVYDWLGTDFQALFYCWFTSFTTGILIGLWLVWSDLQVLFFSCFMHGLTHVFFIWSIKGEIQLYYKAGFLIDLTCGSLNFGFFYLFSRNSKPIKLKSCRNLYHKGDNLGNITCLWCMIIFNYIIRFWYW